MNKNRNNNMPLPNNIRGRSIRELVIPTVCNLENMLNRLDEVEGEFNQLEQWEKRSYRSYHIEDIIDDILHQPENIKKKRIKEHILHLGGDVGASCADIYLVAYIADNVGEGRAVAIEWILNERIAGARNSAQAIWQVGKGDGVYLDILNQDSSIEDRDFLIRWVGEN